MYLWIKIQCIFGQARFASSVKYKVFELNLYISIPTAKFPRIISNYTRSKPVMWSTFCANTLNSLGRKHLQMPVLILKTLPVTLPKDRGGGNF